MSNLCRRLLAANGVLRRRRTICTLPGSAFLNPRLFNCFHVRDPRLALRCGLPMEPERDVTWPRTYAPATRTAAPPIPFSANHVFHPRIFSIVVTSQHVLPPEENLLLICTFLSVHVSRSLARRRLNVSIFCASHN